MQTVAHAVQHLIRREGRRLRLRRLPMGVADLINGKAMTFLRRALSEELEAINIQEVSLSLGDSFRGTGMDVSKDVLSELAEATGGYPYLIQLVGYYVWQRARIHHDDNPAVTSQDVSEGVSIAMSRFHEAVHEPAISGLSSTAVDYLLAMARDPGPSSAKDLAARLGRSTKSLSSVQEAAYPAAGYRTRSPWLCGLCHSLHEGVSAGERGRDKRAVRRKAPTLPLCDTYDAS